MPLRFQSLGTIVSLCIFLVKDIKCHSLDLQRYPEGITAIEAINKCGASGLENDPLVLTKVTEIHGREFWTGLGIFTQLTPWIEIIGCFLLQFRPTEVFYASSAGLCYQKCSTEYFGYNMAQVLAKPGDVRHGFSYIVQFNHDFGRITGIAATIKGNILLCDYDKKNLILVDSFGSYLKKLEIDSEPYDIAVTSQNIGYITLPNSRSVLQIDPDRMVVIFKAKCNDTSTTVSCVSAVPNTGRDFSENVSAFFDVKIDGFSYAVAVKHNQLLDMAQVLAVPGDVRHGFSYVGQFNHDFARITGIAATIKGNILLCDYDKKNLILVDPLGIVLKKLNVDSEPYDVAITSQNIGYITQPKSRSVLQIDPDRMVELFQATCNDLNTTVTCVSAVPNTGRDYSQMSPCYFGVNNDGCLYVGAANYELISKTFTSISQNGRGIGSRVVKFHTFNKDFLSCIGGQNYIRYNFSASRPLFDTTYHNKVYNFSTLDSPTDICSDDNSHIYVKGQGSNNIHRLVEDSKYSNLTKRMESDWKVLDIPLDTHHGIKEPVALCFNKDFSKLYIVNEWGKSVLVFDVI